MPSRRRFLTTTAAAVATGAASAGCLGGVFESGTEAYLQFKAVSVSWTRDGDWYRAEVLDVAHHVDDGTVEGYYDPEYASNAVQPATRIEVGESLHDRLTREFDEVDYVLGACGEGFGDVRKTTGSSSAVAREARSDSRDDETAEPSRTTHQNAKRSEDGDAVGCLNQRAGREDFDAAPLTARVSLADRDGQFDVLDADSGEYTVEEVALRERAYDDWVDD